MRRILLGLTCLAVGCATSSAQLEDQSRQHAEQAAAAASINDFNRAAKEQERANDLHAEAVKRALKEGRASDVAFANPGAPLPVNKP